MILELKSWWQGSSSPGLVKLYNFLSAIGYNLIHLFLLFQGHHVIAVIKWAENFSFLQMKLQISTIAICTFLTLQKFCKCFWTLRKFVNVTAIYPNPSTILLLLVLFIHYSTTFHNPLKAIGATQNTMIGLWIIIVIPTLYR